MKDQIIRLAAVLALAGVSACSTAVNITSSPSGAKVFVNEKYIGETPLTVEKSNLVFNSYNIRLSKEGYRTINSSLEKEAKAGPIIGGLFVLIPFFWSYGPQDQQNFSLEAGKAMLFVPEKIQVTLDSQTQPLKSGFNTVASGRHTISIQAPKVRTQTFEVDLAEKQVFEVALQNSVKKQS